MKYLYLILLFGFLISPHIQAEAPSTITIEQVLHELHNKGFAKTIGFEEYPTLSDKIPNSELFKATLKRGELSAIGDIIAKVTDYESLSDEDYFIIYPKKAAANHDLALVLRRVAYPNADNLMLSHFLEQIKSLNKAEPVYLTGSLVAGSDISSTNLITTKDGTGQCYEVFNEIARQLKANYWKIGHSIYIPSEKEKIHGPIALGAGNISFYRWGYISPPK